MAVRTTATEVKQIMDEIDLLDAQIDPYITASNIMVNQVMGTTTDTDLLGEIERWLAAHMITITRDRLAKKEEAGGAKIEYVGVYGMALESTQYGQMVIALDTTGAFAALSKKPASLKAIDSFD